MRGISQGLPEHGLVYLLYALSYHPDFDDGLDDEDLDQPDDGELASAERVYKYFASFVKFFLEGLLSSQGGGDSGSNNFSLIMKITHTIKQCADTRDPANVRLYKLAELAQLECRHL